MGVVLTREDVEAIAARVVQLLGDKSPGVEADRTARSAVRLVDAATLADALSVERDWVYGHANELGAIRLGGEHGRLRFDLDAVRERMQRTD